MNQSSEVKTKNTTFLIAIKWIVGIILIVTGLFQISTDFISGLLFILVGIIPLPPFNKLLKDKFNLALSRYVKVGAMIVLIVIAGSLLENKPSEVATTVSNEIPTKTEPQVQEVVVATAPKPKTLEEKITEAINSSLGSQTNTKKPRLVDVQVTKYTASMLSEYGYKSTDNISSILIIINSDENLTSNLQKSTMDNEASKLIQSIFPIDSNIGDIIIWSQLPVKDKYGNTKDDTAIIFSVSRPLSAKINWSNFNYRDLPTLLKSEEKVDDRNGYFEKIRF